MKLLNIALWKTASQSRATEPDGPLKSGQSIDVATSASGANVVPLRAQLEGPDSAREEPPKSSVANGQPHVATGPLGSPLMTAFFAENYFGLGRHNGAHFRTRDALDLGKSQLIARFQNVLTQLVMDGEARLARLKDKAVETVGICGTTSARLDLACSNVEREINELRVQLELAGQGKGWVLEALNRYQIGFTKGLHDALSFDLLAN